MELAQSLDQLILKAFKGFSKLPKKERLERLVDAGVLSADDVQFLSRGGVQTVDLAEHFIENVIGYFQVPLGVATNFVIDGRPRVIPMAVEETSIIAAASKTARWIGDHGSIETSIDGSEIIGQIQISKVQNFTSLESWITEHDNRLIEMANEYVASGLVRRGGGVKRITVRKISRPDGGLMAVIHVMADPCDAMGANIINQVCEYLKKPIEEGTGEKVSMCILSNLVDTKLTRARVRMKGLDRDVVQKIAEASLFAQVDPYRAATNNKGVMNGIDPILVVTGNDWRAVEAGVHAYATHTGQYRSITTWIDEAGDLVGELVAPLVVGTVGGVTRLHPTAKMALRMMEVEGSEELSRICAAVGLVQNLGALRALTTVGIIEGHMKLHIRNLTLGAGATDSESPIVQRRLEQILAMQKRISLQHAIEILRELRSQHSLSSSLGSEQV